MTEAASKYSPTSRGASRNRQANTSGMSAATALTSYAAPTPMAIGAKHVQAAVCHRSGGAHEERPAGPRDERLARDELDPLRHPLTQDLAQDAEADQRSHGQGQQVNRQCDAGSEAMREVGDFRIRLVACRRCGNGRSACRYGVRSAKN